MLAEHSGQATALHLYGAVLITATLLRVALAVYLRGHPGLRWEETSLQGRRLSTLVAAAPLLVYVLAMLVATSIPWLSLALYLAMPALYLGLVALLKTDPRTRVAADDLS